jgi:hypothetical protein
MMCDHFVSYYGADSIKRVFSDFICTLGLKDAYGRPKQAWTTLKHEIAPRLKILNHIE